MHDSHDLTPRQPENHPLPARALGEPGTASPSGAQFEALLGDLQKLATVGQLTSGVAHEFNNLLQGIVGSLELVRKLAAMGRAAETDKFSAAALSSARRAAALTERLLHFAQPLEALSPQSVDVNALIGAMLDLLRGTQSSSIRMETALDAGLSRAMCDPGRLEEAIVNVVVNAREAMPQGGNIVIQTANADIREAHAAICGVIPPGHYVCVSIADGGPGMTREQMQCAVDPFAQSHAAAPVARFALRMVQRFAQEAGGYIDIESERGSGSKVRIYLLRT